MGFFSDECAYMIQDVLETNYMELLGKQLRPWARYGIKRILEWSLHAIAIVCTYRGAASFRHFRMSLRFALFSGSWTSPFARRRRNTKSAWATSGSVEVRLPSMRSLNCLAKSVEMTSARFTTSIGTPARLATWVPKDDEATPSTSLYKKTSYKPRLSDSREVMGCWIYALRISHHQRLLTYACCGYLGGTQSRRWESHNASQRSKVVRCASRFDGGRPSNRVMS